ncbi:MAG: radical SAM family heme chaperone HemW [Chitinophagaceae bacterium]
MAGIYIHIPFCRQACSYCNFHFTALPTGRQVSLAHKNEFVAALLKEIDLQRDYLDGETVETVYFGGGTPSLLTLVELESILSGLRQNFIISKDAELTLEANPDDIAEDILNGWRKAGINRLSLGIQSFFDADLQWMNRAHTAAEAKESLKLVREYFDNMTADLIYGTPTLPDDNWKYNVGQVLEFSVPHISCYALTVEPKTPLQKLIRLGKAADVNQDRQSDQFLLLMQWLEENGYEHYEISNFAKPGFRSRHNSSYWQGKKYLGLGPSAHSFDGSSRQWNIANNSKYISSLKQNLLSIEKETLTNNQQLNEYIMTSLRTMEGLSLRHVEQRFGKNAADKLLAASNELVANNRMIITSSDYLVLTKNGKLLADGIASDLFVV